MKTLSLQFNDFVDKIYSLPLEDKVELKNLLEHNIAESKRNEIAENYMLSRAEEEAGKLMFSSNIAELKKIL